MGCFDGGFSVVTLNSLTASMYLQELQSFLKSSSKMWLRIVASIRLLFE